MLERLKALYQARGHLSGLVIDEADGLPSSSTYTARFGSLGRAYQLVGFTPERDLRYIEINRALRDLHATTVKDAIEDILRLGGTVAQDPQSQLLTVNREFTVSICIARCRPTPAGTLRWQIRFDASLAPDVIVAARMDRDNHAVQDFYILPYLELPGSQACLGEHNGLALDAFRFDSLEHLFDMAARVSIGSLQ